MAKSKRRIKVDRKLKKLRDQLKREILWRILRGEPSILHLKYQLAALERVIIKRKDQAAQYRQWREEKRQNKLNKLV